MESAEQTRVSRVLKGSKQKENSGSQADSRRGAGPGSGSPSGLNWAPPDGTPQSHRRKPGSAPRGNETGSCGRPPPSSAAPAEPWGGGSETGTLGRVGQGRGQGGGERILRMRLRAGR